MQSAFDIAVDYVHDRKQFGKPVGTFQLIQGKIAGNVSHPQMSLHEAHHPLDMYTKLNASRSYVYAVGRACDKGQISRRVRSPQAMLCSS